MIKRQSNNREIKHKQWTGNYQPQEETIMTEQEKMLAGKIYDSSDETLLAIRTKAHKLCQT